MNIRKVILRTALITLTALVVMFQACKKDNPAPSPSIAAFAPASGLAGATVVITGTNFGATTDKNVVTFAGTAATVTAASATSLTVTVPNGAATGKIAVTVGGNSATSTTDFTVLMASTITSFTPASALPGASVTIVGTNFDATPANNTVKFNGTAATVTTASTTQLVVTVPAGVTNGKITVTTSNGTATSATDFTYAGPSITALSAASGKGGDVITITGTNFDVTAANNVVKFNGTVAYVSAASATQLTATILLGSSTGKVTVTVNGQTGTSANDFTVVDPYANSRVKEVQEPFTYLITDYFYDANNRVTTKNDYLGGPLFDASSISYNAAGQALTSITNYSNHSVKSDYIYGNGLIQQIAISTAPITNGVTGTYTAGALQTFTYYQNGLLATYDLGNGNGQTTYTYGTAANGNIQITNASNNSGGVVDVYSSSLANPWYNPNDPLSSKGLELSYTDATNSSNNYTISYTFDQQGRVITAVKHYSHPANNPDETTTFIYEAKQ